MKKVVLVTLLSSLVTGAFAAQLDTDEKKISYTIGKQMGDSLQTVNSNIKLDREVLFEAITDSLDKKPSQLDEKQMDEAVNSLQVLMGKAIQEKMKAEEEKNRAESVKFLEENKKKDGVKVTKSGLQYRVIKAAEGEKPTEKDVVKVHYKGSLVGGTVFDSTEKAGKPIEFPLNAVISGWTEGLQLMSPGAKYEFVIPAELAYGDMAPPSIGPARALIFEVELLEIKKAPADQASTENKAAPKAEDKAAEENKAKATPKAEDKAVAENKAKAESEEKAKAAPEEKVAAEDKPADKPAEKTDSKKD